MPYITSEAKDELFKKGIPASPAELNFLISMLCLEYKQKHGEMYTVFNDIIGALECCKLEFVRRVVNPYETLKANLNGDIYAPQEQEASVSGESLQQVPTGEGGGVPESL